MEKIKSITKGEKMKKKETYLKKIAKERDTDMSLIKLCGPLLLFPEKCSCGSLMRKVKLFNREHLCIFGRRLRYKTRQVDEYLCLSCGKHHPNIKLISFDGSM